MTKPDRNTEHASKDYRHESAYVQHAAPSRTTPALETEPEERPAFIGLLILNTLVIGDSILKEIKTRGLRQDVKIVTLPGKKTRDACIRLRSWDMSECENVVLYIGENDVAAGKSVTSVEQEFRCTLDALDNGRRRVFTV